MRRFSIRELQTTDVMQAEMQPDIYAKSGKHKPDWVGVETGSKDGPDSIGPLITLGAEHFPPGSTVVVNIPLCPRCEESADAALNHETGQMRKCTCGFDWVAWAEINFA